MSHGLLEKRHKVGRVGMGPSVLGQKTKARDWKVEQAAAAEDDGNRITL